MHWDTTPSGCSAAEGVAASPNTASASAVVTSVHAASSEISSGGRDVVVDADVVSPPSQAAPNRASTANAPTPVLNHRRDRRVGIGVSECRRTIASRYFSERRGDDHGREAVESELAKDRGGRVARGPAGPRDPPHPDLGR